MISKEQITNLTGNQTHPITKALEYWTETSERFNAFIDRYQYKIRKKCTSANSFEDLEDIKFELEIPYLFLLDQRFEVEYEKRFLNMRRSPDFSVTFERHIVFNVEVKRIRQADLGQRFDKWMEEVVNRIGKVPSNLGFSLDMANIDGTADFLEQLESKKEVIINYIEHTILNEEKIQQSGDYSEHLIPGIDGEFILHLNRLKNIRTGFTVYLTGLEPIFYNQKESYKFSNTIFEKLTQMVPGMINIIICSTASTTHEREDLPRAITSINSLIKNKDNDFFIRNGFESISDFLNHTKNISAILFKGIWYNASHPPNLLWCNSHAEHIIPEILKDFLRMLGCNNQVA
jgi:hypothetical protein